MKTVTILLTKYSDWISTCVYCLCGKGYTHASLSLDDGRTYYSFNYKGFCVETLEKHRRRGVEQSLSYQLNVTEAAWKEIEQQIILFSKGREQYRYTRLGLFLCMLKIPFKRKGYYFCSQFVAELLTNTHALDLNRLPALYLPNDFRYELEKSPQLDRIIINPLFNN